MPRESFWQERLREPAVLTASVAAAAFAAAYVAAELLNRPAFPFADRGLRSADRRLRRSGFSRTVTHERGDTTVRWENGRLFVSLRVGGGNVMWGVWDGMDSHFTRSTAVAVATASALAGGTILAGDLTSDEWEALALSGGWRARIVAGSEHAPAPARALAALSC